jgi:calcineurin-like phosphoesterase family protein
MPQTWFISDTHFFHKNIMQYSGRPFKDVDELNDRMIKNYCAVVRPEDTVYHLGDFSFGGQEKVKQALATWASLPGTKHLNLGNHDYYLYHGKLKANFDAAFESIRDYRVIKVGKQQIVLCHYSYQVWDGSHKGVWNLYGHSHGTLPDQETLLSMDVGVDATARWKSGYPVGCQHEESWKFDPLSYGPISFDEVATRMKLKKWSPVDHHGEDTM